jgi:S1-C subfamily serine protease
MHQEPAPTPPRRPRSRRLTPAVGVIALVAALAGGAIAAIVTVSLDRGTRTEAATVTVHDVTTVPVPNTLASTSTAASSDDATSSTVTGSTSSSGSTTSTSGTQRTLEDIYKADAPGVVSVITMLTHGQEAQGSGIVLDTAGYILTNEHVIQGQKGVRVSFSNSDNVRAKVIGSDASTDLAVLKVDLPASALHPLPLGDSSSVEVGDSVVAIGNPFGLDRTLTAGIISAIHRQISAPNDFAINNALQTDAAINHGNSGGPLIDRSGAVIGINAQLPSNSEVNGNVGVGFAIPIDIAKTVIPALKAHGHVAHPWLGLEGDTIDSSLASATRVPADHGVLIEAMVPGSPIANAGLVAGSSSVIVNGMGYCLGGDVITEIDGVKVDSVLALRSVISSHDPGETLILHVVHQDGTSKDYPVKLGTQPQQSPVPKSGCKAPRP